jgi:hypothetical protein
MKLTVDFSDDELRQLLRNRKSGETYRELILRLGGVDAPKRQVGRPRRIPSSLEMLKGKMHPTTDGSVARKMLGDKFGEGWKKSKKEGE